MNRVIPVIQQAAVQVAQAVAWTFGLTWADEEATPAAQINQQAVRDMRQPDGAVTLADADQAARREIAAELDNFFELHALIYKYYDY